MKKSQRFKVLVELNATQEQNALKAIGETQQKRQAAAEQLENLKNYHQEYQEKFNNAGSHAVGITQLLEFRSFIDKLDKAIAGQAQALTIIDDDLERQKKRWEALHHKTGSLQKICDSSRQAELKLLDKQEQQAQDERASRTGRRQRPD